MIVMAFCVFTQQITELSGYSHRVSEMLAIFEDLEKGHCKRIADKTDKNPIAVSGAKAGDVVQLDQLPGGDVTDTDGDIVLKDVAIITPCGDIVVTNLTFQVLYKTAVIIIVSSNILSLYYRYIIIILSFNNY